MGTFHLFQVISRALYSYNKKYSVTLINSAIFICVLTLWVSSAAAEVGEWSIQLSVSAPSVPATDAQNIAGISPFAEDGYDILDGCMLPPSGEFPDPNLYFPHPEFEDPDNDNFTTLCDQDVRRTFLDRLVWDFEILTSMAQKQLKLYWQLDQPFALIPPEYVVTVYDLDEGVQIDLRSQDHYTFNSGARLVPRRFQLEVVNAAPQAPSGFRGIPVMDALVLHWEPSPDSDVAGYRIEYGTGEDGPFSGSIDAGMNLHYRLEGLDPEQSYRLQVLAIDRTGLGGSPSEVITCRPLVEGTLDLNPDGRIDYLDLFTLFSQWLSPVAEVDFDGDLDLDHSDIHILLDGWQCARP